MLNLSQRWLIDLWHSYFEGLIVLRGMKLDSHLTFQCQQRDTRNLFKVNNRNIRACEMWSVFRKKSSSTCECSNLSCYKENFKNFKCINKDISIVAVVFNLSILVNINWLHFRYFSTTSIMVFLIIFSFLFWSINIESVASFPQLVSFLSGTRLSKLVMHISIYEFFLILFLFMRF